MKRSLNFSEPHTEAERRALLILRDAELRNDNDYRKIDVFRCHGICALTVSPRQPTTTKSQDHHCATIRNVHEEHN